MRRVEDSSKENKSALAQLISHTKNVERAVTLSQQDMVDYLLLPMDIEYSSFPRLQRKNSKALNSKSYLISWLQSNK